MHNPRPAPPSELTSLRDALLSASLVGEIPALAFSRVAIPNPDALVPPGYYVSATAEAGPCAHCGAAESAHLEPARFCPLPPLEFRAMPERAA